MYIVCIVRPWTRWSKDTWLQSGVDRKWNECLVTRCFCTSWHATMTLSLTLNNVGLLSFRVQHYSSGTVHIMRKNSEDRKRSFSHGPMRYYSLCSSAPRPPRFSPWHAWWYFCPCDELESLSGVWTGAMGTLSLVEREPGTKKIKRMGYVSSLKISELPQVHTSDDDRLLLWMIHSLNKTVTPTYQLTI